MPFTNLHLHGPSLYFRDALGEDEGDAVVGAAGHLTKLPPEELQAALQLLVAALDGQRLQAALVTRQETLRREGEASGVQTGQSGRGGGGWSERPSPHLLTLRPLEVHVAVTLAALGRRPQLPEPVGLGRLGQADVAEGSGGDHHVGVHAVDV